jgi:hypothetical protein
VDGRRDSGQDEPRDAVTIKVTRYQLRFPRCVNQPVGFTGSPPQYCPPPR